MRLYPGVYNPIHRALAWRQMAWSLETGQDPRKSMLNVLSKNPALDESISQARDELSEGEVLSDVAVRSRYLFPAKQRRYIEEGHKAKCLPAMFKLMIDSYRDQIEYMNEVRAHLLYPALLWGLAAVVFLPVIFVAMPTFEMMFADMGKELPYRNLTVLPTALTLAAIVMALVWPYQRLSLVSALRPLYHHFPLLGAMFRRQFYAEFTRNLAALAKDGMALPDAFAAAGGAIDRGGFAQACEKAAAGLREGKKLSELIEGNKAFPPGLDFAAARGEEMGNLPETLENLAERYAEARAITIKQRMRLLETLLVLLILTAMVVNIFTSYGLVMSIN